MIQQKFQQEVFAKPGLLQQEGMLTIQVKNTMLQAAKNGFNTKTPGLHLSVTHGKEAVGQLAASSVTQEDMAQLDWLLLKSPRPDRERPAENQLLRRPMKLTPLELPEKVKEAQIQKLKFSQQEDKSATCELDVTPTENRTRKVRQRLVKAVAPPVSMEPLKVRQQSQSSIDQNGDKHLEDALCQGIPVPLCSKPAPPLLSPRIKARVARAGEAVCQNSGTLQLDTGRRRPRLRRAQCLEEDLCNSNTSTGGLSADGGKLTQGVQSKGQQAERPWRGQPHAGKDIKDPCALAASWERGSARKSQHEGGSRQSARCTLNRQSAEGPNNEIVLDGVKLKPNWRTKRKMPFIAQHNNALPLEILHL